MPREKETYREALALLREKYPDKMILNINETAKATGMSREFVRKHYITGRKEKHISITKLASLIS